jgi:hypothetical protein
MNEYILALVTIYMIILLLISTVDTLKLTKKLYLLIFFIFLFFVPMLIKGNNHYAIMLFAYIVLLITFFSYHRINETSFINFINITYSVYLIFSLLIFFGVLPQLVEINESAAENNITLLGLNNFRILNGMDGGPSNIDTYSALILLINIFVNRNKSRIFFIGASIFAIIASLRFTPIVSIILILAFYPIYKNRLLTTITLLLISIMFIVILFALSEKINVTLFGFDLWNLLYLSTHGRSMIWEQQMGIFKGFDIIEFLLGNFNPDLFKVPIIRIQGVSGIGTVFNPHNTYLLLLFRQPIMFLTMFFLFMFYQFKQHRKNIFPIIFLIFLSGFTNSGIISLGNPIYLYVLIYYLTKKRYAETRCALRRL